MKRSVKFNSTTPLFILLLVLGIFIGTAWAETVELVTYYPTSSNTGDQHTTSLTVGNNYLNTTLANGQALIQTSLGIGPGFGNNQPAAPTLLQVQGVAGQASQALFLPGAGGTMSLDVAGDLFVRQAAGSGNHVRIRGATDPNTGIELRSETSGGTPYIDFANDVATDFDMRIQLRDNDNLFINGGTLEIGTVFPLEPASQLVVVSPFGQTTNLSIHAESDTANQGARLSLMRERGNFAGGALRQPVLNNDLLGEVGFFGFTAAAFSAGAQISAQAAENWTQLTTAGRLTFSTTPTGTTTLAERMRITEAGNVGIGTAAPAQRLHVVGTVRIVDGTQANGRVLTSDANGVASWQAGGGGSSAPDAWGIYTGNGLLDRFIATNYNGTVNGFQPGYVFIWQQHDNNTNVPTTSGQSASHLHMYRKWANQPLLPGQTSEHSFYVDALADDNVRLTHLELRPGENGFHIGIDAGDTGTDEFVTNINNSRYYWMAWD